MNNFSLLLNKSAPVKNSFSVFDYEHHGILAQCFSFIFVIVLV